MHILLMEYKVLLIHSLPSDLSSYHPVVVSKREIIPGSEATQQQLL